MKVEVNRNDEMPKAGDLVIDELGNIGILMHNGYIWLLKHSGKACRCSNPSKLH